jgi:hypothetical protein
MTTRSDLRNLCRRRLGDTASPYHWSDLQINQWINDAIAEYSIHFPRQLKTTLTCSAAVTAYDLPAGFLAPTSVEYPVGEDPPRYLYRLAITEPNFWAQLDCYDILLPEDQSDLPQILLSAEPAAGEQITIHYLAEHPSLDDDADITTVPDRRLELIVLFVRWAAYQELASSESADPDPTNLAMGTLELNAYRARREYRKLLADWKAAGSKSARAVWRMDKHDRIY